MFECIATIETGSSLSQKSGSNNRIRYNRWSISGMSYDVFISYSKEDKLAAGAICQALEAAGMHCWIAPRDIQEGEDWTAAIMHGIAQCRAMVLVFSGHTNLSSHVHREVGHAFNRGLTVIPFRIEDTEAEEKLLYYLSSVQWLNAFPLPVEEYLSRLAARVSSLLAKIPIQETASSNSAPGPEGRTAKVQSRGSVAVGERYHEAVSSKSPASNRAILFLVVVAVGLGAFAGAIVLLSLSARSHSSNPVTVQNGSSTPASRLPDSRPALHEATQVPGTTELSPVSCDREADLQSIDGLVTATITFINRTERPMKVYWLNYSGERVLYYTLKANQTAVQQTFVTHPWVVTDSANQCVGIYLPTSGSNQAILR
jgi:TIR domain/VHL beta domain